MTLLQEIERYLRNTGMAPTTFGSLTIGDTDLVRTMRAGREPRAKRATYLRDWMKANPNGNGKHRRAPPPAVHVEDQPAPAPAPSAAATSLAAEVRAEAEQAGSRRRVARALGHTKALPSSPPSVGEKVMTLMLEEPGDLIAHVRRRWPDLWGGVLAAARAAQVSPGLHLMTVIEAGLAAVGGEER